jgi:hypothetical protein
MGRRPSTDAEDGSAAKIYEEKEEKEAWPSVSAEAGS